MFLTLPKKAQNLAGRRFSCLVALGLVEVRRYPLVTHMIWLCRCDCGNETRVAAGHLRKGGVKSCGCMKGKWCRDANIKHGFADKDKAKRPPEYRIWCHLKGRCLNPKDKKFGDYGGRGVTVYDRWRDSFGAFFADMGPRPSSRHTIDRINNDGDYGPSNCRWATHSQQNRNRRPFGQGCRAKATALANQISGG